MPMYDYRCKACGARFEAWQKFTDDPITVCPTCSGPAQRVIHAAGIMFKGSGFYSTDSRSHAAIPPTDAEAAPAAQASDGAKPTSDGAAPAAKAASDAGASASTASTDSPSRGSSGAPSSASSSSSAAGGAAAAKAS